MCFSELFGWVQQIEVEMETKFIIFSFSSIVIFVCDLLKPDPKYYDFCILCISCIILFSFLLSLPLIIYSYTFSISTISYIVNWITGIIFLITSCRIVGYLIIKFFKIVNYIFHFDSLEYQAQEMRMALNDFATDYYCDQNELAQDLHELKYIIQQQKDELNYQIRQQQQKKPQQSQEFFENNFVALKENLEQSQFKESKKQKQEINQQFTQLKEDFGKQLKSVQTTIGNLTKQQGLLFNLVLDLKHSNANSEQAQKQSEISDSNQECRICLDKPSCFAFVPCGHICACEDCVKKLPKDCPICRNEITGTLKVYRS